MIANPPGRHPPGRLTEGGHIRRYGLLGIANPQSIKRLGHFLAADCKSAGTPDGGRAYPALRSYGSHVIRAAPLPACPVSNTPEGDRKD